MAALFSFETICILAAVIGLLYFYLTWNNDYWTKRGVKSDKPKLLFGSLRDMFLMKKSMGEIFTDIYNAFPNEKVVGAFKFRAPALLIRDPDLVHKILVTDFNSFRNNDIELDEDIDPILGKNIFVKKDDIWKKNRALITPAFTSNKIKAIFPQMVAVSKDFADYLSKHPGELQIKHTMARYTTEIVARCAFGIESNCFKEDKPTMHELGKLLFEPDFLKGIKIMSFFVLPNLAKRLHLKVVPDNVNQFFQNILKDVIVYRQQHGIQRNDLVQYLIDVKKKTIEVEKGNVKSDIVTKTYTDDDVLSGCVMFFVEGYETSSVVLTNILYELAMHRDVQEKVRSEIGEVLNKGELTFEAVSEMHYLNCVLAETNRILPVGLMLQKRCTEPYEMDVGKSELLKIEKDTSIVIPLYGIHNDPKYWEDPDLFKPERFANKKDISAKAKGLFIPFGDGPRMCIGVRIASTLVKVALIDILSRFDVLPVSRTPEKIEPDPTYFGLAHKGGMYLKFVERVAQ